MLWFLVIFFMWFLSSVFNPFAMFLIVLGILAGRGLGFLLVTSGILVLTV